jgi:SAM-dependent methyltransferase
MTNALPPPPHQSLENPNWKSLEDWGGYFPDVKSAMLYAEGVATSEYHKDRLRALKYIILTYLNGSSVETVLDYGVGDGGEFQQLNLKTKKIIGIDISPHMIEIAVGALALKYEFEGYVGSTETIKQVKSESVDLVLCLNVLGYLNTNEQDSFFKESNRVLKRGGHLLVMTGNELFDLFALNAGTAEFFKEHFFQLKVDSLLTEGKSDKFKNANRRNPLKFKEELKSYGLLEVAQSFSQWHKKIPALANIEFKGDLLAARAASRDHEIDPNVLSNEDKWKAFFCCSMFASLSMKE